MDQSHGNVKDKIQYLLLQQNLCIDPKWNAQKEAIWLRQLLAKLGVIRNLPTSLHVDNQSSIKLVQNPIFYDRTKHFKMHYHFSRGK